MRVEILGSAVGGGFPQWNCNCLNCHSLRAGTLSYKSRTQTQVAISDDGCAWFLLSACPDLRMQIERTLTLQPQGPGRLSPLPVCCSPAQTSIKSRVCCACGSCSSSGFTAHLRFGGFCRRTTVYLAC